MKKPIKKITVVKKVPFIEKHGASIALVLIFVVGLLTGLNRTTVVEKEVKVEVVKEDTAQIEYLIHTIKEVNSENRKLKNQIKDQDELIESLDRNLKLAIEKLQE